MVSVHIPVLIGFHRQENLVQDNFVEFNHFIDRIVQAFQAPLIFDNCDTVNFPFRTFIVSLDLVTLVVLIQVAHFRLFAAAPFVDFVILFFL